MVERKDCIPGVAGRTGQTPEQVEKDLIDMQSRADGYESQGESYDEALRRAGADMEAEHAREAAIRRRGLILSSRAISNTLRFVAKTEDEIAELSDKLPKVFGFNIFGRNLPQQSTYLALEADFVGINLPVAKGRRSIGGQKSAVLKRLEGAFQYALENNPGQDLRKLFFSGEAEKDVMRELFELNRKVGGSPGVTKDANALAIAKIIHQTQRYIINRLNLAGAWIDSYSGYITRTTHDPYKIFKAKQEKWANDTIDLIDLKRTFGTIDRAKAKEALYGMWNSFATGNHFDYGATIEEPVFPSLAKKVSASRELHFKNADAWMEYNQKYGGETPTRTIIDMIGSSANRIALMEHSGVRPKEYFDTVIKAAYARLQSQMDGLTQRLLKYESPQAPAMTPEDHAEAAKARAALDLATEKFNYLEKNESYLRNRIMQIDGTSKKPINKMKSNLMANYMAWQRMSKLGHVAEAHLASLPTQSMALRHYGATLGQRLAALGSGFTKGAEGSAKRKTLRALLIGLDYDNKSMLARYDVADAPSGSMAAHENLFFRATGVSALTVNHSDNLEAVTAWLIGQDKGKAYEAMDPKRRRNLRQYGIGKDEWDLFNKAAEWTTVDGETFLSPSAVEALPDEAVQDYLNRQFRPAAQLPGPEEIERTRNSLALNLAMAYQENAEHGIPRPDARTQAVMFQMAPQPGTFMNNALRLLLQFKMWSAAMIQKSWGREIYGTVGDGKMDRIAGLVEMAVGAAVVGTFAEMIKKELTGIDGLKELAEHPVRSVVAGMQRSGMGTILGDFLLGEYDRHGYSALDSLAGPTFGQIDLVMDMIHAEASNPNHPWRQAGADLIKAVKSNMPWMNMWGTQEAMNYLVWYRLQDWLAPGYLQRMEKRMKDQQGQQYWLSPSRVVHNGLLPTLGALGR